MANDKKSVNSLATGVAGAIIGAAAAAAAIALSDEKNRKKAEGVLKDLQKKGDKVLKEITKMALELKDKAEKNLPEVKITKRLPAKKRKS